MENVPEHKPNFVNSLHAWVSQSPPSRLVGPQVSLTEGLIQVMGETGDCTIGGQLLAARNHLEPEFSACCLLAEPE